MAFRHFNNQKLTIGNHQSKGFLNSVQSAWRATLAEQIAEFLSVPLLDQESTNLPFIPSSFAPLRLCARQSLYPGTFDSGCLTANPFIPVKSFPAPRRKDAKFFRIGKFRIFRQNGIWVIASKIINHQSSIINHQSSIIFINPLRLSLG